MSGRWTRCSRSTSWRFWPSTSCSTITPGSSGAGCIGLLLGLAFLVKGPVGILLPLVMILAGRTATGRDVVPSPKTFITTLLALSAVVLPWGLVFVQRVGGSNVVRLLRAETVERAAGGAANLEPWWYYLAVCLVAFLPWAGPLLLGMIRGLARWHDPESPTGPYAAAAFGAGLVFFSLSKGKLPSYILPLAPLAALVVTFELGQELVNPTRRRAGAGLVATTLVALSVGLGVASAMSLESTAEARRRQVRRRSASPALVALWGVLKSAPRIVYASAAAGTFAFLLAVVLGAPPVLATTRSAAPLVAMVPAIRSARPLVLVDTPLPSLTFYADPRAGEVARARSSPRGWSAATHPWSFSTIWTGTSSPPRFKSSFGRSGAPENCGFSSPRMRP